jgi:hypothetical protein
MIDYSVYPRSLSALDYIHGSKPGCLMSVSLSPHAEHHHPQQSLQQQQHNSSINPNPTYNCNSVSTHLRSLKNHIPSSSQQWPLSSPARRQSYPRTLLAEPSAAADEFSWSLPREDTRSRCPQVISSKHSSKSS